MINKHFKSNLNFERTTTLADNGSGVKNNLKARAHTLRPVTRIVVPWLSTFVYQSSLGSVRFLVRARIRTPLARRRRALYNRKYIAVAGHRHDAHSTLPPPRPRGVRVVRTRQFQMFRNLIFTLKKK